MKRTLITGGAGFIGSNLAAELIRRGHEVVCFDNLLTGKPDNIRELMEHPRFSFVEGDVTEPFDIEADEIYHLACPASPAHYQEDPLYTAKICFLGSLNALALAEKCGASVLLSSTSEIYGEPLIHPQSESYRGNVSTISPRSCYDEGKRIAETLFYDAKRTRGVDIRIVRIFNTYGPRMSADDGRVVSNFIVRALKGEDITIYGDGSQTRSFCYVDDMVDALIRMMEQGGDGKDAYPGPVNLGNPDERTVLELAKEIRRMTGSSSDIVRAELPEGDPTRRRPDISLAKEVLGWSPATSLEEGLSRTIEYFRNRQMQQ